MNTWYCHMAQKSLELAQPIPAALSLYRALSLFVDKSRKVNMSCINAWDILKLSLQPKPRERQDKKKIQQKVPTYCADCLLYEFNTAVENETLRLNIAEAVRRSYRGYRHSV